MLSILKIFLESENNNTNKMSLSIQQSVIEQFNFDGQTVRSCTINGCECLVAKDVYLALGYRKENGKKAVQNLVPEKYKVRFGDVKSSPNKGEKSKPLHPDTILLKESGLYCFLLRCGKDGAEKFMDWVVETVLPREMRKLSKQLSDHRVAIKEKEAALALLSNDLENRDARIKALEYENVGLQGEIRNGHVTITNLIENRHVPHSGNIDNILCVIQKNQPDEAGRKGRHRYYMIRCQKRALSTQINLLRISYPNMNVFEPECDDPNAIHAWNRFKTDLLGKDNYYLNHFSLPGEHRDFF